MIPEIVSSHPQFQTILKDADHVDVKTFTSEQTLREFIAGLFSYYPGWLKGLFRVRGGFVRLLGMRQEGMPPMGAPLRPEQIEFEPGKMTAFFTVEAAEEEKYYISSAKESHLDAYLGIVVEPSADRVSKQFHFITVVHYNNFTGPIYFNVIRPFHHIVVQAMGNAALKYQPPQEAFA